MRLLRKALALSILESILHCPRGFCCGMLKWGHFLGCLEHPLPLHHHHHDQQHLTHISYIYIWSQNCTHPSIIKHHHHQQQHPRGPKWNVYPPRKNIESDIPNVSIWISEDILVYLIVSIHIHISHTQIYNETKKSRNSWTHQHELIAFDYSVNAMSNSQPLWRSAATRQCNCCNGLSQAHVIGQNTTTRQQRGVLECLMGGNGWYFSDT